MQMDAKDDKIKNEKNCWGCDYQQIAGDTFLGKCTWFSKHKQEKDKEIPSEMVDIGCKYYAPRSRYKNLSSGDQNLHQ